MKRIFTFILFLATSIMTFAQSGEQIVSTIEAKADRNLNGKFSEIRTTPSKKVTNLTGVLEYRKGGDYLSMKYDNGDSFLIDGMKMTICSGGKTTVLDLQKNIMMRKLKDLLFNALSGKISVISKDNDTDILASSLGGLYVVNLMARKKSPRGYSKITMVYDAASYVIKSMEMVEVTGAVTSYTM